MPAIRPIELSARPMIERYLRRFPPEISEFTFTNLFVWLSSRPVSFAEVNGSLVFLASADEDAHDNWLIFGPPVGETPPLTVLPSLETNVAGFVRLTQSTVAQLRDDLEVEPDRDNSDYVYRVADLAELAGRRFHKKRNLIKQCLSEHRCQYEPMTSKMVVECLDMQDSWCDARDCGKDPGLCAEYVAVRKTFEYFDELQLLGGAIRIEGKIQAFAIGEELSTGTAVCHFEKAMPGFRGLGQLINQWFAKYGLADFEFANREQDLGIPGLRQAKESYHPHHMVVKFNAWSPDARYRRMPLVAPHECAKHERGEFAEI